MGLGSACPPRKTELEPIHLLGNRSRCLNQGARYARRILPIVSDLYCLTDVERAHELLSFSKAIVRKPLRGLVGSCGDRAEYRVLGEVCLFQSAGFWSSFWGQWPLSPRVSAICRVPRRWPSNPQSSLLVLQQHH
jgi:hypothetical protein